MIDILFILKKNETYGFKTMTKRSSGLWNSTRFIVESLVSAGYRAEIIEVIDNNCIDKYVRALRPRVVIIEALWVVPEKFKILRSLHPGVKWFVHMHSGLAFLAQEGIAVEWLRAYPNVGVGVIANSLGTLEAFHELVPEQSLTYLPNVYIPHHVGEAKKYDQDRPSINIGCFGAIRPLKNQLIQAIASLRYARAQGKLLHFHINGTRDEVGGQPVHKNIRALFACQDDATLHEHPWYEPEDFHKLLRETIDLSMQVSLSETFNVVSADATTCGVPIVVSDEIPWVDPDCITDTENLDGMNQIMKRALTLPRLTKSNQRLLQIASDRAQSAWNGFLYDLGCRGL